MLTILKPQEFDLQLLGGTNYVLRRSGAQCQFSAPASRASVAKLYTVADAGRLLYVGIAEQTMAGRLNLGLRADGRDGYYGYKFQHLRHPLALSVWAATTESGSFADIKDIKTIEAEVAFFCRLLGGQWPSYQQEIHFLPSQRHHRDAAKAIYSHAIARTVHAATTAFESAN